MIVDQEDIAAGSLVPPRPNLGPEPWPAPPRWPASLAWWGFGLVLACLLAIRWKRRRPKPSGSPRVEAEGPSAEAEDSPRQRLIASSEVVRSALIGSFGAAWGSKTTEEIGGDPALLGRFEPEDAGRLVGFLRLADRVKFASSEPEGLDDWEAWASSFSSKVAASGKSKKSGG